jgi:hypothetical protein
VPSAAAGAGLQPDLKTPGNNLPSLPGEARQAAMVWANSLERQQKTQKSVGPVTRTRSQINQGGRGLEVHQITGERITTEQDFNPAVFLTTRFESFG